MMDGRDRFLSMQNPGKAVPASTPAERALAEAEERRRKLAETETPRPQEEGGPKGPEPTRYGDWENKGIASDF
jgi:hypothetical protein